jgi:hypothetical protein
MTLRSASLLLVFASLTTVALAADPNSFILVNSTGKPIGKASYSIDKTKDGFRVRTKFQYRLSAAEMQATADPDADAGGGRRGGGGSLGVADAQYTAEYKISATGDFLTGFTQNVDTQMLTSYQPDKKGDILTIGQVQAGVSGGSRDLPLPSPHFLLTPDYDPSALQVLLSTALTHPHPDSTYALVVPAGANPRARGNNSLYVTLQPELAIPASGTLAGKPVVLKHYLLNYHQGHADLYADTDGNLMEAELGPLSAKYIRAGFALAP